MQLDELTAVLAQHAPLPGADGEIEISSLAYDSRAVQPGALFFCVPGFNSDGHDFAAQALALKRSAGIEFSVAIFTNLSRDHLDFHDSMEDYFDAKRRLFVPDTGDRPPRVSVINVGDPYGARLAEEVDGAVSVAVDAPA